MVLIFCTRLAFATSIFSKLVVFKIFNVNYELLVSNQEDEIKKIINYLGLEWENNCLFPEKNNHISITASNLQVKKRIYKNSSRSWENFKPYINGAFDNL